MKIQTWHNTQTCSRLQATNLIASKKNILSYDDDPVQYNGSHDYSFIPQQKSEQTRDNTPSPNPPKLVNKTENAQAIFSDKYEIISDVCVQL